MMPFFKRALALVLMMTLMIPAAYAQEEAMNILLIGVDTANGERSGRSDAMILVRADVQSGVIRMVSFLRDLYVSIEGVGRTRLNAAYFYGGEELLKATIRDQFGIAVDRTATVHFAMLEQLVDQLGGIDIEITPQERRQLNALLKDNGSAELPEGAQHLNGRQALYYSRIRKLDSDFQRTSRQHTVIAAMLKQASALNPWQLLGLAISTLPQIQTDLTLGDLAALLPLAGRLEELSFQTAHVPFEGAYRDETINGMMVLNPDLEQNRKKLHDFLYGE